MQTPPQPRSQVAGSVAPPLEVERNASSRAYCGGAFLAELCHPSRLQWQAPRGDPGGRAGSARSDGLADNARRLSRDVCRSGCRREESLARAVLADGRVRSVPPRQCPCVASQLLVPSDAWRLRFRAGAQHLGERPRVRVPHVASAAHRCQSHTESNNRSAPERKESALRLAAERVVRPCADPAQGGRECWKERPAADGPGLGAVRVACFQSWAGASAGEGPQGRFPSSLALSEDRFAGGS
mmetsp:Transcript_1550/g.6763  ORF Transcript_1550/g.6763 Transcript_1550/m.6763 type:complete len:241 (-) Transcript_1550:890-1612(-)